ncbi:MAG: DUF4198 domain-containing protein [Campylobacterales bacterium]
MRYLWLIIITLSLGAHDLWIDTKDGQLTLFYGHYQSHDEEPTLPYESSSITTILCDESGIIRSLPRPLATPLRLPKSCNALLVVKDSGFWTKSPYGTKHLPKTEVPTPLASWKSLEIAQWIERGGTKALGEFLQFLITNPKPSPWKKGERIRLQLIKANRPIPNAPVAVNSRIRGVTDQEGRINLTLPEAGLVLISASHTTPYQGPEADSTITTTTLSLKVIP